MDPRPLILGEAPARTGDPEAPALQGRSAALLAAWAGLDPLPVASEGRWEPLDAALRLAYEVQNLLPHWPGSAGRGAAFPREQAERARDELLPELQGRSVVLLGARLARVFGAGPRHAWVDVAGARVSWIYHPSGLTRQYNEAAEREAAGRTLREALAGGVTMPVVE